MNASIPYYYQEQATDELAIEDIGNCAIIANDDLNTRYFLLIRTVLGVTGVVEYGAYRDGKVVPSCQCSYMQFDYSEKKIYNIINKFLNNPRRCITQAQVYNEDMKDLVKMIKNPVRFLFDG